MNDIPRRRYVASVDSRRVSQALRTCSRAENGCGAGIAGVLPPVIASRASSWSELAKRDS